MTNVWVPVCKYRLHDIRDPPVDLDQCAAPCGALNGILRGRTSPTKNAAEWISRPRRFGLNRQSAAASAS